MSTKTKSNLVLLLTTLIWGTAFIAQKNGGSIGAFTFNGIRTVIGGLSILPVIWWMNRHPDPEQSKKYRKHGRWSERKTLVIGGCLCGTALFLGANLQQMGINYTTVSKAGFITSLYSILVPVLALFIGKKVRPVIWLCMAVSAVGLYLLCMRQEAFRLQLGDALILVCAVFFAVQILLVDYFIQFVNPVKLSFAQTMFSGIVSIICMFLFEHPVWSQILGQALPILYLSWRGLAEGRRPDPGSTDSLSGIRVQRSVRSAAAPGGHVPAPVSGLRTDLRCRCGEPAARAGDRTCPGGRPSGNDPSGSSGGEGRIERNRTEKRQKA